MKPTRRTSFARRDSNLALLSAVFAGVVIAFALLLLVIQRIDPDAGSRMRGATADALSPVISVVRAPIEGIRRVGAFIGDHMDVAAQNQELKAELQIARNEAAHAAQLQDDLERMEALLKLRRPERRVVAGAIASAFSADAGRRHAIISAGFNDGVRPRMPVIGSEGLGGRVTDVGQIASRIMLLTDADSRVRVKVLRTGWTGLAVGTGGTLLEFHFDVASGQEKIMVGDVLVTSGDGGLFPPGIPVATIIQTSAQPPLARPQANPTGLGRVMIEAPWQPPVQMMDVAPAPSEPDLKVVAPAAPAVAPAGGTAPSHAVGTGVAANPRPVAPAATRPVLPPAQAAPRP